jgi:UDP:flavonoid glycosyltransferase YjiC (YdhE family)
MVAVPAWSDQPLNAHLVEEWSVGVRAERDADGILTTSELASCVELLMGHHDKARKIIATANHLKKRAKDALAKDAALLDSINRIQEVPI